MAEIEEYLLKIRRMHELINYKARAAIEKKKK